MDNLESHPIISCPGSLLHGLGVWADHKLQEVCPGSLLHGLGVWVDHKLQEVTCETIS